MIFLAGFLWTYGIIVLGGSALILLVGLRDYVRDRWHAYLARQVGPVLAQERSRHAAHLAEARRQHQDAQQWLMETHRMELDRAVAEAMTSCARDPMRGIA